MYFDVFDDIVIESVDIYPTAAIGSNGSVVIRDNNQNVIYDIPFTTIVTGGNTPQTIRLDAELTPGTDYEIGQGTAINLMRNSSGAVFPYTLPGLIELTDTSFNAGYYYWYYNWFISAKGELICESPRQEVIATIDQSGDIQLDYTDLPYLDTNNTSNYGNNFSGAAGDGCMGTNYLNGYEAMYYYEADPNKDDILTIKLSNASNPGGAVFIYDSCGEVGINCLNGAALESGVAIIEDLYIEAGQQLLIVVSSISGTMSYDLEIYGVDCNNLSAPSGNATPYFVAGDMVEDLKVEGSIYNQGFKWYRDATLNSEITDPKNEALIDGTSYFVTQTILDCESTAFEIVPMQFDCGLMAVNPQVEDVYICAPGGEITLKATASGIGNEVIWYDAETDGNLVGRGSEITVNVNANTSYWATEIFSQTASGNPNAPLATYCTPTFNTGCTSRDFIDDFILETSTGGKLIEHLGTGCSPNAYADYTGDSSLSAVLVAGNSYNFIATHGTASQYIRIWIDIDGNGSFEDAGELVYESTSAGSTTIPTLGSFDIPEWAQAGATVMRVKTTWSTGASNSCTQSGAFGEVHDYKVDIIGESVICESFRTEYKIRLNDVVPNPPVVTPLHKICGDGLLSDILVLGDNITWYGANGVKLNLNTPIIEGQRYYVTQTVKGCESATQEVVMHFNDKSDLPVAPVNQSFETGETLQDLTVHGEKLRWYKDRFKTELLNVNTRLVDQTTYYVTQELEEYCESDPLGITVHEVLDIEEQLFEHFEFYPNPVEDILYVVNSEIIEQVEIFDLAGRKVITLIPNKSDLKLNVEELSTGVYLLKAKVEGMERVFRIIKK